MDYHRGFETMSYGRPVGQLNQISSFFNILVETKQISVDTVKIMQHYCSQQKYDLETVVSDVESYICNGSSFIFDHLEKRVPDHPQNTKLFRLIAETMQYYASQVDTNLPDTFELHPYNSFPASYASNNPYNSSSPNNPSHAFQTAPSAMQGVVSYQHEQDSFAPLVPSTLMDFNQNTLQPAHAAHAALAAPPMRTTQSTVSAAGALAPPLTSKASGPMVPIGLTGTTAPIGATRLPHLTPDPAPPQLSNNANHRMHFTPFAASNQLAPGPEEEAKSSQTSIPMGSLPIPSGTNENADMIAAMPGFGQIGVYSLGSTGFLDTLRGTQVSRHQEPLLQVGNDSPEMKVNDNNDDNMNGFPSFAGFGGTNHLLQQLGQKNEKMMNVDNVSSVTKNGKNVSNDSNNCNVSNEEKRHEKNVFINKNSVCNAEDAAPPQVRQMVRRGDKAWDEAAVEAYLQSKTLLALTATMPPFERLLVQFFTQCLREFGNFDFVRSFSDALGEVLFETCVTHNKLPTHVVYEELLKSPVLAKMLLHFPHTSDLWEKVQSLQRCLLPYMSGSNDGFLASPSPRAGHSSPRNQLALQTKRHANLLQHQLYALASSKFIHDLVQRNNGQNDNLPLQFDFVFLTDRCALISPRECLQQWSKIFPFCKTKFQFNENTQNTSNANAGLQHVVDRLAREFENLRERLNQEWCALTNELNFDLDDTRRRAVFVIDSRRDASDAQNGNNLNESNEASDLMFDDVIYLFTPRVPVRLDQVLSHCNASQHSAASRGTDVTVQTAASEMKHAGDDTDELNNFSSKLLNYASLTQEYETERKETHQNDNNVKLFFHSELQKNDYLSETMLSQTLHCLIPSLRDCARADGSGGASKRMQALREPHVAVIEEKNGSSPMTGRIDRGRGGRQGNIENVGNIGSIGTARYRHVNGWSAEGVLTLTWQIHESETKVPLIKAYVLANQRMKRFFVTDVVDVWPQELRLMQVKGKETLSKQDARALCGFQQELKYYDKEFEKIFEQLKHYLQTRQEELQARVNNKPPEKRNRAKKRGGRGVTG